MCFFLLESPIFRGHFAKKKLNLEDYELRTMGKTGAIQTTVHAEMTSKDVLEAVGVTRMMIFTIKCGLWEGGTLQRKPG